MKLTILYEDDAILVCRKPAGVAVQTARLGEADMESLLKNYRAEKGEEPWIGVVHRLDQPVEGVMVFAKTKEAAASLGHQMRERLAEKDYYAVTDGIPAQKKGMLEDYLLRDGRTNLSSVVAKTTPGAKRAALSYEVIKEGNGRAVLRIRLQTGRHHQIRVQLAHAGMPIAGDRKYQFREHVAPSGRGLSLCACRLVFRHPADKRKLEFEIDNPYTLS